MACTAETFVRQEELDYHRVKYNLEGARGYTYCSQSINESRGVWTQGHALAEATGVGVAAGLAAEFLPLPHLTVTL